MYSIPEEFENATLFIPFTQVRRENGVFQKLSSNRRNLKTPVLRFSWDRILKTKLGCDNRDVCLPEFYSNRNPKCTKFDGLKYGAVRGEQVRFNSSAV